MNEETELRLSMKSYIYNIIHTEGILNAEKAIQQYLDIFEEDPDIIVFQSLIQFEQNNVDYAKSIILKGIKNYPLNEDLRYNAGYLCEKTGEIDNSVYHYHIANLITEDQSLKEELLGKISGLCSSNELLLTEVIKKKRNDLPKISVIITAYNQMHYLQQAVESILNQSYPYIEVVIADDCSTDGTQLMMKKFEDDYRVRYMRNSKNMGPGINGCHAFYEYADGEYVLFVNHDDYLTDTEYILKAICLLERNKSLSFVFANCTMLFTQSGLTYPTRVNLSSETNGRYYFMFYETKDYPHITSLLTSVFRRELAVKMDCLLEETKSKDLFLYLKLMLSGNVGFIPDHVGIYRVHEESISYNMPLEFDYLTIKELLKLRRLAGSDKYSFSDALLDKWLGLRLYAYFRWRFKVLIEQNKLELVKELMSYLQQNHHNTYLLLDKDLEEVSI